MFGRIAPHKRLTINVHLDGMRETHDHVCAREGVFDKAIEMIAAAKRRGYHVMTNTTVFKETAVEEIEELCALVTEPGRRRDAGLARLPLRVGRARTSSSTRQEIHAQVRARAGAVQAVPADLDADVPGVRGRHAGLRLLALEHGDVHAQGLEGALLPHRRDVHPRLERVLGEDRLGLLGVAQGSALPNCAMHSGFEASAVRELRKSPRDMLRMAAWNLTG